MILKELDPFHGSKNDLADRIEADRLAYYLRRYFRRSREVDVINGLRVHAGNSFARVDHLLLHAHGLLVLERELAIGVVQIDDDGQWSQWDNGLLVPRGSPITRAYVQALLLKSFLDRRVQQKGFFDRLELVVLVGVSDTCDSQWPATGRLAEVCKRDDVRERVDLRLEQCKALAEVY